LNLNYFIPRDFFQCTLPLESTKVTRATAHWRFIQASWRTRTILRLSPNEYELVAGPTEPGASIFISVYIASLMLLMMSSSFSLAITCDSVKSGPVLPLPQRTERILLVPCQRGEAAVEQPTTRVQLTGYLRSRGEGVRSRGPGSRSQANNVLAILSSPSRLRGRRASRLRSRRRGSGHYSFTLLVRVRICS